MTLRIGVLGAAGIVPNALIGPAKALPDVEVTAVAARDPQRAKTFAAEHGIPRVHASYAELLEDRDLDAVYNALPNGLHGRWSIAALEAGRHLLCEKPFAANAEEAERVAEAARRSGRVVMEAVHYRYHALTARLLTILDSGEIGEVQRIDMSFITNRSDPDDIRWNLALAGGATMDLGCYAVHLVRTLAGAEPRVVSATAELQAPDVDAALQAELAFPDGRTGSIDLALLTPRPRAVTVTVTGSAGVLHVDEPIAPHRGHLVTVTTDESSRKESVPLLPTSYDAQLAVFADAVLRGGPVLTDVDDAVANMRVVDALYAGAGLPLRQPTP